MQTVKLGIVGCGNISDAYLTGGARSQFVSVKAVTDIDMHLAEAKAATYGCAAVSLDEMMRDPEIAIIVNLTPPVIHAEIGRRAISAGKHFYSEKPLAVTLAEAKEMVAAADTAGLRIGSAPDTFLGASHQLVRSLIDEGRIGDVVGGAVTFATAGMEMWHPNPFFFYAKGGGPVLDIGCYPLTQLVNCLGPVESVTAYASRGRTVRTVTSKPHNGRQINVEVPTTVNGVLAFASGANVSFTVSWDIWKTAREPIELYGTEGSILNPDPNFFGGAVRISARDGDWETLSLEGRPFGAVTRVAPDGRELADYRMAGVFDMAAAIEQGRPHRANGDLALHVLEVMEALETSAEAGRRVPIESRCTRPEPVPPGQGEEVFLAAK